MQRINAFPRYYALINERRSCRAYRPDAVPPEMIRAIIDTARIAPSACNRQPWGFVVVTSPEGREAIINSYSREWIKSAPAFIVACGNHSEAWHRGCDGKDHTDVDVSIAVEHICLAATSFGLGTCWVCNFEPAAVSSYLGLPDDIEPIAIIPIGYPADADAAIAPKKRKPLDEIIRWEKY